MVITELTNDVSGVPLCPIEYQQYLAIDVANGLPNVPRTVIPPIKNKAPQIMLMIPAVVGFHVLSICLSFEY